MASHPTSRKNIRPPRSLIYARQYLVSAHFLFTSRAEKQTVSYFTEEWYYFMYGGIRNFNVRSIWPAIILEILYWSSPIYLSLIHPMDFARQKLGCGDEPDTLYDRRECQGECQVSVLYISRQVLSHSKLVI